MLRFPLVACVSCALFVLISTNAVASPIYWQIDTIVHGTVTTPAPPSFPPTPHTLVNIPTGTPLVIDLAFDSNTPNACGANSGGSIYPIGFGSGNTGTMHFLGWDYGVFGGIEIGTNACGGPGGFSLIRLATADAVQTDPNGVFVDWLFLLNVGGNLVGGPPPPGPGQLPTTLPTDPYPTFATVASGNSDVRLTVDFAEIRTVPEPGTFGLLTFGLSAVAAARNRLLMGRRRGLRSDQ